MGLYTSLRIVRALSVDASRGHAADSLEGASMESAQVLATMEAEGARSLLIEGRAGIGKSTWAIHLAQLQNFEPGVVILLRLSDVSAYLAGKQGVGSVIGLPSLSLRELIYFSLGTNPEHFDLVDQIYYRLCFAEGKIAWLVDGLDEVISHRSSNPLLKELLDSLDGVASESTDLGGRLFRPSDLVVVTSREERGGTLSHVQFAAAINPWTDDEAQEYIRNYFHQPQVRENVQGGPARVSVLESKTIAAITEQRFGSFSTLPIVLEMLCWFNQGDDSDRRLNSVTELYAATVAMKFKLCRDPTGRAITSSDADLLAFFTNTWLDASFDGVFFTIDCTNALGIDAKNSGLLRVRHGTVPARTRARFVHKSFLEYFQALNLSTDLTRLSTMVVSHHLNQTLPQQFTMYSDGEGVCICSRTSDVTVDLELECVRSVGAPIKVAWLTGKQEMISFKAGLDFKPLCKWKHTEQPVLNIRGLQLHQGAEYFIALRPSRGTQIIPVRCKYTVLYPGGHYAPTPLEVTQELPQCDIPSHRQQRNFFQILSNLVKSDSTKSVLLLKYLFNRLEYHHVRTASWMCPEERSLATPTKLPSELNNDAGGSSRARALADMGLFIVVECAASLIQDHRTFATLLDSVSERSSWFGRLIEGFGILPKSLFEWALLPCATHGSLPMWRGIESLIPGGRKNKLRVGSVLQEALLASVTNKNHDIDAELVCRGVSINLTLASRIGATAAVIRGVRADATDSTFHLAFKEALASSQLNTANALWELLTGGENSRDMTKTWQLMCSPYTDKIAAEFRATPSPAALQWLTQRVILYQRRTSPSTTALTTPTDMELTDILDPAKVPLGAPLEAILQNPTAPNKVVPQAYIDCSKYVTKVLQLALQCCNLKTTKIFSFHSMSADDTSILLDAVRLLPVSFPHVKLAGGITDAHILSVAPHLGNTRRLDLIGCTKVSDIAIKTLSSLTQLQHFDVSGCENISDVGVLHFASFPQLEVVNLDTCVGVTDVGVHGLAPRKLSDVRHLTVSGSALVTDASLSHMSTFAQLQHLDLSGCNRISDVGLRHLASLTQLRHCDVSGCDNISDVGLGHLALLKQLQHLNVSGCESVGDVGLRHLALLKQLQHLDVSGCENISDVGVLHLASLPRLEVVNLDTCVGVTDVGVHGLAPRKLSDVRHLTVSGSALVTNPSLSHMSTFAQLQHLDLSGCKRISDVGLRHLASSTQLRHFDVSGCDNISDVGLGHLALLKQLQHLNVSGCGKISDVGLRHLASSTQLQHCDVSGCDNISDVGLGHLALLKQLRVREHWRRWPEAPCFVEAAAALGCQRVEEN